MGKTEESEKVSKPTGPRWAEVWDGMQGVSSHGKPGKVMEFHSFFPGLEKSWKLTPGFGKFIKSGN